MKQSKKTFNFEIVLSSDFEMTDEQLDALFEAGLDDSSPGISAGVSSIIVHRQGLDLESAILSALNDVERALIGASVLRVLDPDGNLITTPAVSSRLSLAPQA